MKTRSHKNIFRQVWRFGFPSVFPSGLDEEIMQKLICCNMHLTFMLSLTDIFLSALIFIYTDFVLFVQCMYSCIPNNQLGSFHFWFVFLYELCIWLYPLLHEVASWRRNFIILSFSLITDTNRNFSMRSFVPPTEKGGMWKNGRTNHNSTFWFFRQYCEPAKTSHKADSWIQMRCA